MASKRHKRFKSCSRKMQYNTQALAIGALITMRRQENGGSRQRNMDKMHTYKCHFCHNWHVGHYGELKFGRELYL